MCLNGIFMRFMVSARAAVARCQSSRIAGVIFGMRGVPIGKLDFVLVEAEILHHCECEIDASLDFAFDLRSACRKCAHRPG